MSGHGLSKSKITAWRQCPKRLWLETHRSELLEVSDQAKQAFQTGHEIGGIAQQLCPGGILIDDDNLSASIESTKAALLKYPDRPIFEATFQHDGLLVRADVLLPTKKGYRMAEVKSSSSVKPSHVEDCTIQAWVLKKNKIRLATIELAYVDKSFVYQGDGNYHGLLQSEILDEEVKPLLKLVPVWISDARHTLSGAEPAIEPGAQCNDPYECPFNAYCTRDNVQPKEPKYPLDILNGMSQKKKDELRSMGYVDARKVPAKHLNVRQQWIQQVSKKEKAELLDGAARELAALPYPRYYLDFETINLTVPRWANTNPKLTHVPFQWSCHIEDAHGKLQHEMFLDVSGNDPRRMCAEQMIMALVSDGPVFVYFQNFEKSRIAELAALFPDLAPALHAINQRIVDLYLIAKANYCHPDMKGSWSIKAVLPTIAPDLDYTRLAVGNGLDAQAAYKEILHSDTPDARKQELTEGLCEYCTLDTLAMVQMVRYFSGAAT